MAVGNFMFDEEGCDKEIKEILALIEKYSVRLYLPVDFLSNFFLFFFFFFFFFLSKKLLTILFFLFLIFLYL